MLADMHDKLELKRWEATASCFMRQLWLTDCRSVRDSLSKPLMAKIADKRLGIEIAAMRQCLWRMPGETYGDPLLMDSLPTGGTDVVRWIDTD